LHIFQSVIDVAVSIESIRISISQARFSDAFGTLLGQFWDNFLTILGRFSDALLTLF